MEVDFVVKDKHLLEILGNYRHKHLSHLVGPKLVVMDVTDIFPTKIKGLNLDFFLELHGVTKKSLYSNNVILLMFSPDFKETIKRRYLNFRELLSLPNVSFLSSFHVHLIAIEYQRILDQLL